MNLTPREQDLCHILSNLETFQTLRMEIELYENATLLRVRQEIAAIRKRLPRGDILHWRCDKMLSHIDYERSRR